MRAQVDCSAFALKDYKQTVDIVRLEMSGNPACPCKPIRSWAT